MILKFKDFWIEFIIIIKKVKMSSETLISYEFKITGMTCVACSSAIEKGII